MDLESYLRLEATEMYGLLKHYEELSFSLFKYFLTSIVAIVSIMVAISEKIGKTAQIYNIDVLQILNLAFIFIGLFVLFRQLWLHVRMIRTLRQINSIRGYYSNKNENISNLLIYPKNPLKPSFFYLLNPFQMVLVIVVNASASAIFFTKSISVKYFFAFIVIQLIFVAIVLIRVEFISRKRLLKKSDIVFGSFPGGSPGEKIFQEKKVQEKKFVPEQAKCPKCGSTNLSPAHPHPDDYASAYIQAYCNSCGHELTPFDGAYENTDMDG